MKKLYLTFCLITALFSSLIANPVDQQKAQKIGAKFLSTTAISERNADIQLQLVSTASDRDAVDYYVFNVANDEGFVIVAGDDRVKPILAYSTTGHFDSNNVAEGFQFTLDGFRQEIQYIRKHNFNASPDILAEWKSVTATGHLQKNHQARAVVGPLCKALWDQDFPWNSQCPEDPQGPNGHVYAGCIATALGMVMKYHDWPNHGAGSHTYSFSGGYGQQTANFGETDYHFELMPYTLDSLSTEEDHFYIAQLLYHIGIAVDMIYGPYSSVSYSSLVGGALRGYFRYDCDYYMQKDVNGNNYSNEEWAQILKNGGLDEHLPLFYSGSDDNSSIGHAFVCDGYDENDYFHFNWGLSGCDNAWCPIGALNYANYSFNTETGFTGHIVPQQGEYYNRPDSISNMQIVENYNFNGVKLHWTNPLLTVGGDDLASITSVTIRRNRVVIAELTDAPVGDNMEYEDNGLEPGLYEYAIYVTNEAGISHTVYRNIIVGEKCDITFILHDDGGDGWKGACISIISESGQRIAIVGMDEGSEKTVTLPLLKGNLNFIWNHGWFHFYPGWDTDPECSFSIVNSDGEVVYTSSTNLQAGVFLTYENNCEESPLICYPIQSLEGEYYWTSEEDNGAYLTWNAPNVTLYLDHFNIYRFEGISKPDGLVAEIPYNGSVQYEFFDNLVNLWGDCYQYWVTAAFTKGVEQCESDKEVVYIVVTELGENTGGTMQVYPSPTNGLLNIEGQGTMRICISNLLGQCMQETIAEGNITLDLSCFESGMYLIRIETKNGITVQKVNLISR